MRSLEAALWAFAKSTFENGALLAVNLGDADTTGAAYGQIAGALALKNWHMSETLVDLVERLFKESAVLREK